MCSTTTDDDAVVWSLMIAAAERTVGWGGRVIMGQIYRRDPMDWLCRLGVDTLLRMSWHGGRWKQ